MKKEWLINTELEREFGFTTELRVPRLEYVLWLEDEVRKARAKLTDNKPQVVICSKCEDMVPGKYEGVGLEMFYCYKCGRKLQPAA